ncbi:transketolase [Neptuniibacter sp.]|uniref:transketolase n=1 Tax=Neptuniibacter sp. TaxID=1962643 RepID=UPI00261CCFBD|nr:transketolase [Neptuniibacter sp.]MCP4595907.1 transketolase [Neptuniibacter sp.]
MTIEINVTAATIRKLSITSINSAGSGHPGGALSCADIMACIFQEELGINSDWARNPARNRFILSKGHSCPAMYAAGSVMGLIEAKETYGLRHINHPAQGHPDVTSWPWVETSTGSLGQGFSVAVGIALGLRHQSIDSSVYTLLGDGELQEGEVWEAAMSAAHFKLASLCAIIDYNKLQSDNLNENIMGLEPLADKWSSFGWNVLEINGHEIGQIREAFKTFRNESELPTVIIAHTIKGKGVSFMEKVPSWHGSVSMTDTQTSDALKELGVPEHKLEGWISGSIHGWESKEQGEKS